MHLLATTALSLDETIEAIDLGQRPGAAVAMSFSDGDLAALAAAWRAGAGTVEGRPLDLRLVPLAELRHPMSVDLWIDTVGRHARAILVRLLGGLDWWRYGIDQLAACARAHGIALIVVPGDHRDDPRLAEASTVDATVLERFETGFRTGGPQALAGLLDDLAALARREPLTDRAPPAAVPPAGFWDWRARSMAASPQPAQGTTPPFSPPGRRWPAGPDEGPSLTASALPSPQPSPPRGEGAGPRPLVLVLFYRALHLAADAEPVGALCAALEARGIAAEALFVTSLKDPAALAVVEDAIARLAPAAIVTTTAFAIAETAEAGSLLDKAGVPVFQAVIATTKRAAWAESPRGLGASDLAMHVVLPELDGRLAAGTIAFKDVDRFEGEEATEDPLGFTAFRNRPESDRIAHVADRIAGWVNLGRKPAAARRVAILMPDYPGAAGRAGYAVGLDVPESALALVDDLAAAGYRTAARPADARTLIAALDDAPTRHDPETHLTLADYRAAFSAMPEAARSAVLAAWGDPAEDADLVAGAFRFRALRCGRVTIALPPERGRAADRRADYHDPALPPRHALLAFGFFLQREHDALIHLGAHGTLEWLPGKAVALTAGCFPEIVVGALPVVYPFIVSNPGEAAQAKRRIGAVTPGHLTAPLVSPELAGPARDLERLVDEYAMADGLDRRRRDRLARLIVETAQANGLAADVGLPAEADEADALKRIDAWLCDLKELAVKDGLHVYGRAAADADPARRASAASERDAVLAALDGRRVRPGPAGAPARGRTDVMPTGRNLFTADPRAIPTPTATDLGRAAAEAFVRTFLQDNGDYPRAIVLDLWGSATLRTAGEEIALGLALLGCRPTWDHATGRVTGIEVLPLAVIGRPRVDVTWRVSGLFRDLFPTQIALLDAATEAVAARDEPVEDNPLTGRGTPARVFGSAPGTYGSGAEAALATEGPHDRAAIGAAYLAAASHAFRAGERDEAAGSAFAERVAEADALVHVADDPGRDLLEGSADAAFVGGFAAARAALGKAEADLVVLDTSDPARPRARPLGEALARIVRGRAIDPRFIAGQMRHGPRGAAEFAETVDRLIDFAETTRAVPSRLIDLVHEAYVADPAVAAFLTRENPAAARAIARRLDAARLAGLWHPRRNDVALDLARLAGHAEAAE
ncbi:cobaltochelatase subunit CobN [Segnochrobactrum spirostomi]|uniref:Cobaltochelatase subunit CobN n=1 Tax=Segnochrobactrum spirostomi TaxID=2608987 RepID=A0A6A7Y7C5_9HYPH|nr:cobaltochelatase subunit CobN [Segnochrobactrum spirostomi]MQT13429.1 cobaltochelatase subunit CobN [Segnochrobactrum spirostomi]